MMNEIKIPVGRSSFMDIRKNGYYFIDKSRLIEELIKRDATQVTLITRPRRFGKTLAMSMLSEFFDIQKDSRTLFEKLSIAENETICREWMNQYPTLFLSFRSVDGLNFEDAYEMLQAVVAKAYKDHLYLMESECVNPFDQTLFSKIAAKNGSKEETKNGLLLLTQLMAAHYRKPVILLLDEYDVPLAKASEKGYYTEMLDAVKGVMQVIKDNEALKFAVITGCLQVAKESIFTGKNNFVSDTISDTRLNEFFGFTQAEVDKLLEETGLACHGPDLKAWYDGYRFGDFDVYCPWDVMNHVQDLIFDERAKPKNFWENTSDNAVIRSFLERTGFHVNDKFETLLAGGHIKEPIVENLTYDVLESSEENLWSLLYLTGYLTKARPNEQDAPGLLPGEFALKIPNIEVRDIFKKSVKSWFYERTAASDRRELFAALWSGDEEKLTTVLSNLLFDTISYHDYRESFYHAFLAGLFSNAGHQVESNYENGLGRSDLVIKDHKNRRAAVIEAKRAEVESQLEAECHDALRQIEEKQYARRIERLGFQKVEKFGIAFFQKTCFVKKAP